MKLFKKLRKKINDNMNLLLTINITDLEKFKNKEKGSCTSYFNPMFNDFDEETKRALHIRLDEIVNLIRNNVDANKWL